VYSRCQMYFHSSFNSSKEFSGSLDCINLTCMLILLLSLSVSVSVNVIPKIVLVCSETFSSQLHCQYSCLTSNLLMNGTTIIILICMLTYRYCSTAIPIIVRSHYRILAYTQIRYHHGRNTIKPYYTGTSYYTFYK
jgi:hypothetical protein